MTKYISIIIIFLLLFQSISEHSVYAAATDGNNDFSDVPETHWAYGYIKELRELGITDGTGNNNFGLGMTITRAEFAAFMCKLMGWEVAVADNAAGSFADNTDSSVWYFGFIETALQNGAVLADNDYFYPNTPITREDMAVMIVRTLGYDGLGKQLGYLAPPFPDVQNNVGYITIAKDLGIINGISDAQFAPDDTATREQAAAMLIRMYSLLGNKADFLNGFYAINSYSQISAIDQLNSVCFGWSRLELNNGILSLNTSVSNNNEYNIPKGYQEPISRADGKNKMLMVAVRESDNQAIINDDTLRDNAVDIISQAVLSDIGLSFDGVLIDFETLKGEQSRNNFNSFLSKLKENLPGKQIYVTVQPQRRPGISYYDGYDYKTIGGIADKVILMAHDYYPRSLTSDDMANGVTKTPAAPLDEVYYAIKSICDPYTGVSDKSKVLLQISFDSVQWKSVDGKTINQTPYNPAYSAIVQRIQSGAGMGYDAVSQSPYISFFNSEDQTNNVVWYEDTRSVEAKVKLADLFGLGGISYWRLGIIPDFPSETFLDVLAGLQEY
ncbi:MAG: S-layer homology domain-containing protein [Oscillospiraceae bacterium]|nr:S-layer homology domain-containing protein [Oscillospiraceae bacterium]